MRYNRNYDIVLKSINDKINYVDRPASTLWIYEWECCFVRKQQEQKSQRNKNENAKIVFAITTKDKMKNINIQEQLGVNPIDDKMIENRDGMNMFNDQQIT